MIEEGAAFVMMWLGVSIGFALGLCLRVWSCPVCNEADGGKA